VPIGADVRVDVEVVEQNELARQFVEVGVTFSPNRTSEASPLPSFISPSHLVVGAVLLDDVDHVLDGGQRAGLLQLGIVCKANCQLVLVQASNCASVKGSIQEPCRFACVPRTVRRSRPGSRSGRRARGWARPDWNRSAGPCR